MENPTSEPVGPLVSSSNDDAHLAGQMLRAQELGDSAETARLLGELIDRRIATANTSRDGDNGNSAVATVQKFFERVVESPANWRASHEYPCLRSCFATRPEALVGAKPHGVAVVYMRRPSDCVLCDR